MGKKTLCLRQQSLFCVKTSDQVSEVLVKKFGSDTVQLEVKSEDESAQET